MCISQAVWGSVRHSGLRVTDYARKERGRHREQHQEAEDVSTISITPAY